MRGEKAPKPDTEINKLIKFPTTYPYKFNLLGSICVCERYVAPIILHKDVNELNVV